MSTENAPPRGALMWSEIHEQPAALQRLLDGVAAVAEVAEVVARRRPRFVLFAARGTSDHAALYAKYLVETVWQVPAGLVSASTITGYGARPDLREVLWVAVSQSGGSPDLVESTRVARAQGALTLAVTNNPGSELAAVAELGIDIVAGPELAVAATKSYASQLLALYLFVELVAGRSGEAAHAVPAAVQSVLDAESAGVVARAAERLRFADRLVTTARGYAYPTAREAALKLMETSYVSAHAFSAADLMHGPLAMVDADRPVIVVAPHGVGGRAIEPVLTRLDERGAEVMLVGDERWVAEHRRESVATMSYQALAEEVAPIAQIVPLQLLAWNLAVARGFDPDVPRGLAKVTRTH